jgi:hypothetical protein
VSQTRLNVVSHLLIVFQLSNAEMYKLVPEILRRFTVEMAHDEPWKTHNATFVLQSNVICKIKRRSLESKLS